MKKIVSIFVILAMVLSFSACYSEEEMEEAREIAYESGYAKGYDDGYIDGYTDGYTALKPVEEPESGTILFGKNSGESTMTVYAYEGSCVFSLRDVFGNEIVTFYVREGDTVVVNVPKQELFAFYACGFEWYGYGKGLMFGEDTEYIRDYDSLDFRNYSYTYNIGRDLDGRFLGDHIPEDIFFG